MFLQNKKIVSILLIISMTLSSGSFRTFAEDVIESSIQKVTINTDKDIIEQETFNEVNKAPLKKIEEDTNDLDDNNFAEALEEVIISRDDDVVERDDNIYGLSIGRFKIVTYDKEMVLYHNDSQTKVDELKAFIDTHTAIAGWYVANFNDDFEHIVDSSRIVYSNDSLKTEIETWYQDNNMATVNKACGVIYRRYSCVPQDRGINELPSDEWEYVDDNRYLPSEYAYLNADGSEFINSMSIPVADFKIRNKVTNEIKRTKEWAVEDSNGATISFATKITKPTDLPFSHAGYGEIIYAGIALWPVFGDVEVKSFSIYGRGGGSIVLTPDMNYSDCVTEIDNLCDNSVRGFKLLYHDENEPSDMQKSDFGLHDTDFKNTTIKQLLDRFREWFFNPEYYVVYAATYGGVDYEIVYKMDNITQLPDITTDNRYPSGTSYRIEYTDTAPDVKISVQDYEALDTQFKNENNTSNIYLNIPGEASFFVQPYYTKEWNTAADGSGETYALGAAIKPEYFDANYNLVLYPIWEEVRLSQFYLNRSSQIKTVYAPKEKFNPTNLKINCSDGGSSVIEYSDDLVNAFIFEPSLDDELTVDDTKVTVTLKGRKMTDGSDASFDIPITVGNKYSIKYEENHPSGNWVIPTSRISDYYTMASDSETTINTAGTAFTQAMQVKGNTKWMIQQLASTNPTWKRLKEWNTKADGSGTRYTIGQSLTAPTTDFSNKKLTLYAIWEDVIITQFRICYKNGNAKEVASIYSYDFTTYFDTVISNIPLGYDAFYLISNNSSDTDDAIKANYDPSSSGSLTVEQLKANYNTWINAGANTNPVYGAIYKEKHFYVGYTDDGTNKSVEVETGWNNDIDLVQSKIKYSKLRGWYEILPSADYNVNNVKQSYNPDINVNLITTDKLKATFSEWNSNKIRNFAYGASVSPLKSIQVKAGTALKKNYKINETLDITGLEIVPTYNDNTTGADISYNSTDFEISPAVGTKLTLGHNNTNVTIKYGPNGYKKTCTYTLTVLDKEITSIALKDGLLTSGNLKTDYIEEQKLEPKNLCITVTYDDASTKDVNYAGNENAFSFDIGGAERNIQSYELAQSDAGNVTINYGGKTCTYPITIKAKSITSISVKSNTPNKRVYNVNDPLDVTGLMLNLNYDNGKISEMAYAGHETDFSFDPIIGTPITSTNSNITITYNTFKITYQISFVQPNTETTTTQYIRHGGGTNRGGSLVSSGAALMQNENVNNVNNANNATYLNQSLQQRIKNAPVVGNQLLVSKSLNQNTQYAWEKVSNNWLLKNNNSNSYHKGWALIENNGTFEWYHFGNDNKMTTGVYVENGKYYYFQISNDSNSGRMLTGEQVIAGRKFRFSDNGQLLGN